MVFQETFGSRLGGPQGSCVLSGNPDPASIKHVSHSMMSSTVLTHFGALVGSYVPRTEVITVSVKLKQLWENTCH